MPSVDILTAGDPSTYQPNRIDYTAVPDRPMWPEISDAAGGLNPFIDQHRVRKFADTTHMSIGVRWPMGGHDNSRLGERNQNFINPRKAEEQRVKYAGSWPDVSGWTMPQEGWRLYYNNWPAFFNSDYYTRIVDWTKPGILDGTATPTYGSVPLVQLIRPHGGISHRESYGYFDALEAAELGQPWLVAGFYESIRNLRNLGVDHIVHLGKPDRNEEWDWRSASAKSRVENMLDYGKCITVFDNVVTSVNGSVGWTEALARWNKGAGFAIEGIPLTSNTDWDTTPYSVMAWADDAYAKIITGSSGSYELASTSAFETKYGAKQWIFSFGSSMLDYYGSGLEAVPDWDDGGTDVSDYLDAVETHTKAFFAAFNTVPYTGTCHCLLDHRIINLAIVDGRTVSDFIS